MEEKYTLEGDTIIKKDGHTMFYEDIVRDLNYYYEKFILSGSNAKEVKNE